MTRWLEAARNAERESKAPGHDWDKATACCKRCGRRWLDLLVLPPDERACVTAANVVGITHRIARGKILTRWRDAGLLP